MAVANQSLTMRLREPRRLAAIGLLAVASGLIIAFDFARGENAGADAIAYWNGVQAWLSGGDPYAEVIDPSQASGRILPYAYPPWTLVLFLPWAMLPWAIAWFVWRWGSLVLFSATVAWAYKRRPLGTALVIAILGPAIAANFDTGNINILIAVGIFVAQLVGPRLGGLLWALGTALKVLPGVFLFVLPPRARGWGLIVLAVAAVLTLATWPQTLKQFEVALNFPRPIRLDYLMLAWAAVPWLWAQPWPPWWLQSRQIVRHWRDRPPLRAAVRRLVGFDEGANG